MERLDGWLREENLKGFLVALSEIIDYRFGDLDWGAFEASVHSSAVDEGWFTYPLVGRLSMEISVSRIVEEGEIRVRISMPGGESFEQGQVRGAWMVFNRFDVSSDVDLVE
ncbi:hypothetical protein ABZX40_24775 [Streptomyces sp. NPDC004610]|uniref:hypothetical protein n=1 Tax=unclassified Streptomyces TaxID=2593676 RepID=UPI0033A4252D